MKQLLYIGPHKLEFREAARPKIKSNEVLLKIKSVGICGTDLHIYKGGMDLPTPVVMGHEFSGIIEEVGSEVKDLKIGDRVAAEHVVSCGQCVYCLTGKPNLCSNAKVIGVHQPGALSEYLAVPSNLIYKTPKNISFEEAALIEPLSIAYYAVKEAGFLLGKKVAVIGQGPIGLLVDQVLKQAGAVVIGIDVLEERLNFAKKKKWIDMAISSQKDRAFDQIKKHIADGVDISFEVVGLEKTADLALEITRRNGDVFLLGVFESPARINLMNLVKKELNVHGSWTCSFSFPPSIDLISYGKIDLKSLITHRYKFNQAIKAFKDASSYSDKRIKTVINF